MSLLNISDYSYELEAKSDRHLTLLVEKGQFFLASILWHL